MASWILTPPGDLADDGRAALAQITARCAELAATRDLVREFADMLCHRHGERLEAWASQAEASPVSELRGFSKGLRRDWAAVAAGLTVSYSSGPVEGHVNRIKMIKRQMYGRAKPDLQTSASCSPTDPSRQLRQSHRNLAVDSALGHRICATRPVYCHEMRVESVAPGDLAAGHARMAHSGHLGCVRRAGTYCRSSAQIGHAFGVAPAARSG